MASMTNGRVRRLIFTAILAAGYWCRCDRRGSGRHVRGVTCRVHVDGDNAVVTVGIAFRVTVASLYAPRGKSGALARI